MSDASRPTEWDLIRGGQGLVRMIALRVHRSFHERFDLDDLISYGQLGLAQAAKAFDHESGHRFSTYAYHRIRGAIYDGIAKMSWRSRHDYRRARFGARMGDLLDHYGESTAASDQDTSIEEDSAWLTEVTRQSVVISMMCHPVDAMDAMDRLTTAEDSAPDQTAEESDLHEFLRALVGRLPESSRTLIQSIYFDGLTLQQAADQLGISKSWASRLHAQILSQLAMAFREDGALAAD
ncbi:MAG: sigma-70 family RNA polymerase sigma factor [Planctomycetaceae bacterium]|nr:sigma-70 family RNA polymerase sigma factor [Planctomycetaceae bacterium]